MAIRAIIVDDEPLARGLIRSLLEPEVDLDVVAEYAGGTAALKEMDTIRPDLMFLDVQMPRKSGIEVARALAGDEAPYIIFVTAYDRYAIDAFELNALDYVLKPIDPDRFSASVRRARKAIARKKQVEYARRMARLKTVTKRETLGTGEVSPEHAHTYARRMVVRNGGEILSIRSEEINWIEAANQYVQIHSQRGSHTLSGSLAEFERRLDPSDFVRIHRSAMVRLGSVAEVRAAKGTGYEVKLWSGDVLPLSRRRREALGDLLDRR
jgi:two-component system LytT family response regulator